MKKFVLGAGLILAATAAAAQVAPVAQVTPRDGVQTRAEAVQRARAMFARVDANRDGVVTADEGQAMRAQRMARRGEGRRMAQGANGGGRAMLFDRLDTNRGNLISRDEWSRMQELRGQRAGQRGERMAMRGRMGGAMLRGADTNRDQRLSLAEAEAAALQRFDRIDRNRDGRITQDERQQARQQWRANRPAVQPVR